MEKNLKKDVCVCVCVCVWATQLALAAKNLPANAGDASSVCIPESLCWTAGTVNQQCFSESSFRRQSH